MILRLRATAGKRIKLEEEDISEILVADTYSESGTEASDVENYFGEEEEGDEDDDDDDDDDDDNNNNKNNSSSSKPQQSHHNKHWPVK
jgi:hypothetical protein